MKVLALLWFVISVIVFLLTFIFSFRKHRNLKTALKGLLLGVVLTDVIMLSSLFYYGNVYTESGTLSDYDSVTNKNVEKPFILLYGSEYEITTENKVAFAIFYALMNAPKMGALGLKYSIIFVGAFDFPWNLGIPYGIFILILSIITPVIFGGFLVSYIKALWNFLSYQIQKRIKNVYYFSDLNERSMLLAEDIAEKEKHKSLIVFCNCNKVAGTFEDRIDQKHFIVLPENERDLIIRFSFGHKKQYFFEISDDDNRNLDSTNEVIKRLLEVFDKQKPNKNDPFEKLRVYVFMDSSLFGSEKLFASDQDKINIFLVDKIKASVYNLLFKKPLCYELKENENKLSIAVFGNGAYAKEFFKNSIWASVLDENYTATISYIDPKADSFEKNLRFNCPGLFPNNKNNNLKFYKTDLQSSDLDELLKSDLDHPNYIVVDTGDDNANVNLAIHLRMFYVRQSIQKEALKCKRLKLNPDDYNFEPFMPFIAVRIKDSKTANRINRMRVNDEIPCEFYSFYSFGSDKETYSYNLIDESPIDKLALNCDAAYAAVYNEVNKIEKPIKNKKSAVFGCNKSEFLKSTNKASAIHIKNKLFLMGLKLKSSDEIESQEKDKIIQSEDAKKIINDYIIGKNNLMRLKKYEHERWNLFHFSEGWKAPALDECLLYSKLLEPKKDNKENNKNNNEKKHKYVLARLHGCLCSWKKLDSLEKIFGKFKEYDEIFIRDIPSILGMDTDNPKSLNISGVEFSFLKK